MSEPIPWWYCTPSEPVPVPPVRPDGFVLFADYDTDFRYPLASSRMVAPISVGAMEEGCFGCTPTLIDCSGPTPCPECPDCPDPVICPDPIECPDCPECPECPDPEPLPPTLLMLTHGVYSAPDDADAQDIVPLTLTDGAFVIGTRTPILGSFIYGVIAHKNSGAVCVVTGNTSSVQPYQYVSPSAIMATRTDDDPDTDGAAFYGAYSPDGQVLALARDAGQYLTVHSVSGSNLMKIPLTTGLVTPIRLPCWSPDSKYLVAMDPSPRVYKKVGSVLTDITATAGIAATGTAYYQGAFSPDGAYLVLPGRETSGSFARFLSVYANNGDDTFTFVRTVPLGSPSQDMRRMVFSSDGSMLFVALNATPCITAFSHDGSGNFVRLSAFASAPTSGQGLALAISHDDSVLALGTTTGNYLYAWNVNLATSPSTWTTIPVPVGFLPDHTSYEIAFL